MKDEDSPREDANRRPDESRLIRDRGGSGEVARSTWEHLVAVPQDNFGDVRGRDERLGGEDGRRPRAGTLGLIDEILEAAGREHPGMRAPSGPTVNRCGTRRRGPRAPRCEPAGSRGGAGPGGPQHLGRAQDRGSRKPRPWRRSASSDGAVSAYAAATSFSANSGGSPASTTSRRRPRRRRALARSRPSDNGRLAAGPRRLRAGRRPWACRRTRNSRTARRRYSCTHGLWV